MNLDVREVYKMGLVPYQQAWDLQTGLAEQVAKGERPPTLLLLEHPHVYTFGRRETMKTCSGMRRNVPVAGLISIGLIVAVT